MPCNQMMSMNCNPPRAIDASKPARLPALNALIRNRPIANIGWSIRVSTTVNATNSAPPPMSPASTQGLSQPMSLPP